MTVFPEDSLTEFIEVHGSGLELQDYSSAGKERSARGEDQIAIRASEMRKTRTLAEQVDLLHLDVGRGIEQEDPIVRDDVPEDVFA